MSAELRAQEGRTMTTGAQTGDKEEGEKEDRESGIMKNLKKE